MPKPQSPLPSSPETERALVGALLFDGSRWVAVRDIVRPEHLLDRKVRVVLEAIDECVASGSIPDVVTVANVLQKGGRLASIGGPALLAELAEAMPSAANVEHYARIVYEKAALRKTISLTTSASVMAREDGARFKDVVPDLQRELAALVAPCYAQKPLPIAEYLTRTLESVARAQLGQPMVDTIPTGITDLDYLVSGFARGELVLIAGRPSMGKSALAFQVAKNMAARGNSVLIFSVEMDAQSVVMRWLSEMSGMSLSRLRHGRIDDAGARALAEQAGLLGNFPIKIDQSPGIDIDSLVGKTRRVVIEGVVDIVVVDYIQLMGGDRSDDNKRVSMITAGLKNLARELFIPVVGVSQLSRAPEVRGGHRRPMLSDLRDSGSLEQDADLVIFVYRAEMYADTIKDKQIEVCGVKYPIGGLAELIVAKNRNGPTGSVATRFTPMLTRFEPIDEQSGTVTEAGESVDPF